VTTIRASFKKHLGDLVSQTKVIEAGLERLSSDLHQAEGVSRYKPDFLTKAYLFTEKKEVVVLENLLMIVNVQKKRSHQPRQPSTFLIRMIQEKDSNKCCLEQLDGIFVSLESLATFSKDHCLILMELIRHIIEDSHDLNQQDQLEVK
jgi:hypothetical protein